MSSNDLPLAAAPRWRQWREHPCYPAFLCWGANVAVAVIVGTTAGSMGWLLLALPSALFCVAFGRTMISGSPNVRTDLAERWSMSPVQTHSPSWFKTRRTRHACSAAADQQ